jgi:cytochrome o ubiquinol oxidase subunit 2
MIYTMNRMTTELNLSADSAGTYAGLSSHYSGNGFADMHFNVDAMPADRFIAWIDSVRGAGDVLTAQTYAALAKQSASVTPFTYRSVEPDLFHKIVTQALPPGPGPAEEPSPGAARRAGG